VLVDVERDEKGGEQSKVDPDVMYVSVYAHGIFVLFLCLGFRFG